MSHRIEKTMLELLERKMNQEEKSSATREKYLRDVRAFISYVREGEVTKDAVIAYKQELAQRYAVASANSMLAALNYFFKAVGWQDCVVRAFKVQREAFRSRERELSKEEYLRLLNTAKRQKKDWLYLIILTICSTGIRVSELRFITVEALSTRRAKVYLKGKSRTVILPRELCRELRVYVREKRIKRGSIFVTKSGKPMDRSNICHAMKTLCGEAGVERTKVFPHNLRHLFAVTYYQRERDVCHLADILGHSSVNTTRIYTLVSCEEQERQINALGLIV